MKLHRRTPGSAQLARLLSAGLIVLTIAALAAYWTNRFAGYDKLEEATLLDMERSAAALTSAVAEQTRSVIYNLDLALRHLQQVRRHSGTLDVDDLKDVLAATPAGLVRRITIIRADGEVALAHPPLQGARVNLADRPHFEIHARTGSSDLYIGPPVRSRFTNEWLIPLSRRLTTASGDFAGVALLVVAPEYFAEIYGRLAAGREDVVALVRGDGAFLSRSLNLQDHLGKSVRSDRPFIADHANREGRFRSISTHEPVDRVFAWRRLDEWPVVVVIGLAVRDALAPLQAGRSRDLAATAAISVLVMGLVLGVCGVLLRLGRNVARLSDAEGRLTMAFAGASELAWEWDLVNRQMAFFGDCLPLFGRPVREARVSTAEWALLIHPDDRETVARLTKKALHERAERVEFAFRVRYADDRQRWVLVRGQTVRRSASGAIERMIGIVLDIDASKRAEMLAAQTQESYARLIENAAEGIFVVDRLGIIEIFNPKAEQLLGLSANEAHGQSAGRLVMQAAGPDAPPVSCPVAATLADGQPRRGQRLQYRHADGHAVPVELSVAPTRVGGQIAGAVVVFADIADQLAREAELESLARTDALTGVANRRHFVEQCERELYRSDRESSALSLLMLDLDRFKSINDRYGHAAGDAVLAAVAQRCQAEMRQIDVFARLGGEEFGAVLPGVDAAQAVLVAERLRQVLQATTVEAGGHRLRCTASFGVATRRHSEGLDALLARADDHLYDAKATGRNRVVGERPSGEPLVEEDLADDAQLPR